MVVYWLASCMHKNSTAVQNGIVLGLVESTMAIHRHTNAGWESHGESTVNTLSTDRNQSQGNPPRAPFLLCCKPQPCGALIG